MNGGLWREEREIMRYRRGGLENWESSTIGHFCFLFRADRGGKVSLGVQGKME